MRLFVAALAVGTLSLFAAACGNSNLTSPSVNVPFSSTDMVVGTGTEATSGKTLTVTYTGWLYDETKSDQKGLIFDTTTGRDPFSFVLGQSRVIKGWDQGLPGMKVGGTRRLIVPPSLAYGEGRVSQIPPNATLIFEVTLTNVQ